MGPSHGQRWLHAAALEVGRQAAGAVHLREVGLGVRAEVAGVADAVLVVVALLGVVDVDAEVAGVAEAVDVTVELRLVRHLGAVVDVVGHAVAVRVRPLRGGVNGQEGGKSCRQKDACARRPHASGRG